MVSVPTRSELRSLDGDGLAALLAALADAGYRVIGPTVRDGAIVLDELRGVADLPAGWTDVQEAGSYRVARRDDDALFGHVVGPHSWKRCFLPPEERLFRSRREGRAVTFLAEAPAAPRLALIGVRACDLAAIAVQDRVLLDGPFADPGYAARRAAAFIVAVQCGTAGGTCFCTSMGTGPRATVGFDLALTELTPDGVGFVVEVGSERGAELLAHVPTEPATDARRALAAAIVERTAASMGRHLDTKELPELLGRRLDSPHWAEVAKRCLACGNCTMVCPTCFCTTVEDVTDLSGDAAERWRRWDSCFTLDFSYLHGGSVRHGVAARYRQWLTHKLSSWHEQFGSSGCVGCGRCITWCPTAIDLTAEARALREEEPSP